MASSRWTEISHQESDSLGEEGLSLGESLCKAYDPHVIKEKEGWHVKP